MSLLSKLVNTTRKKLAVQRVGRGPSSGRGKTSGRGHKGYGSRGGSRRRYGYEGGQTRLFAKLPTRGFTRGRFLEQGLSLNLSQINTYFEDGEIVCFETLRKKGLVPHKLKAGIKILGDGELTKKVTIEADRYSKSAIEKLDKQKINYKILKPLNA